MKCFFVAITTKQEKEKSSKQSETIGMSRVITVDVEFSFKVNAAVSVSLFPILNWANYVFSMIRLSFIIYMLSSICAIHAHYTARVWVWLRIDGIAAFTDDWNNLHQTIVDSLQSESSPVTGNSFIPTDFDEWIVTDRTLQKIKKITIETTATA